MPLRAIAYPKSPSIQSLPGESLASSPPLLLVLLHGWGANAADVASMAPYLVPAENPNALQMLFPDAPFPHPMPGGRMWYGIPNDYIFGQPPAEPHQQELIASRTQLIEWLQKLGTEYGIPLSHTILAGFSQGGAMALDVGTGLPLAGLMILSGYLHDDLQGRPSPLCPVLLVHGRHDPVVPLTAAHQSRDRLQALGATVQYHELDMGHDIPLTVLELMQTFIGNCLKS
ncbi:MAG: esterase [Leptolyngbyaceae bacterium]|nr:esterase [Leptolyngbyaceae bacterium]